MAYLNENYSKLKAGYLFPEIARRVKAFTEAHPDAAGRVIRCGIGDVTEPLPAACREALHKAVDELGQRETFRGYGPEQGYDFLRQAIAQHDFRDRGCRIVDGVEMLVQLAMQIFEQWTGIAPDEKVFQRAVSEALGE
jgi:LL-diaminopimelate aminotransferase